jgi:hypothetical protein
VAIAARRTLSDLAARQVDPGRLTMCRLLLTLALVLLAPLSAVAANKPVPLGIYATAGCDGVKHVEQFAKWFGRKPDIVVDFVTWDIVKEGSHWVLGCWRDAGQKQLSLSLPMLPADGSATLADGAAGTFDQMFRDYAATIVRFGFADAVLRIGWEFNGDWYPWAASKDPESYKSYWRRIVSAMRSVPGAKFRFDWNMDGGWTNFMPEQAYPGDEYVDIIGVDLYNIVWNKDIDTPEGRWNFYVTQRRGLNWVRDFAAAHGKPISFPEWGTGKQPSGGGGDDPYFIEQMAKWIRENDVAYHAYWDHTGGYNAQLSNGKQPLAGAAFKRVFEGNVPKSPVPLKVAGDHGK